MGMRTHVCEAGQVLSRAGTSRGMSEMSRNASDVQQDRAAPRGHGPVKWRFRNHSKGFCLMLQINNKARGHGVIIYFAK